MTFLHRLFFLGLSLLAFSGAASAAGVPLIDPMPISVPAGADERTIVQAIKRGLAGRDWQVIGEQFGRIDADINVRNKHTARIRIDYNEREIRIRYLSSVNLDYSMHTGSPTIHRNYPRWINFLQDDIARNLRVGQIQ
ncbi:hypothetical protein FXN63_18695 [Pigmentiphaga aceris]|uniref:DUF3016 domain-containing protein n=1 Tax=Pigmentiphaga aceris TaxID=1940612 RepID=A0A5C0B359_9BURK|nr:hypothetical protein [Pigmentiphaga aceris]QEI07640.1 hypothetical protein FXN63_18695 [Pigmentiphaga aceris]